MTNLPPGVGVVGGRVYYDMETLEELSKEEWGARRALQWRADHAGEWPSVAQLEIAAEIGHGTAGRALQKAKSSQS